MARFQSVRIDAGTLERLKALSVQTNRPVADLIRSFSYADLDAVLKVHALRAVAESKAADAAVDGGER